MNFPRWTEENFSPCGLLHSVASISVPWMGARRRAWYILVKLSALRGLLSHLHNPFMPFLLWGPILIHSHSHFLFKNCFQKFSCKVSLREWTAACQAPLSIEFSRQEYWSELIHRFIYVRPLGDLNLPTCMVTLQQQWGAESGIPRVH